MTAPRIVGVRAVPAVAASAGQRWFGERIGSDTRPSACCPAALEPFCLAAKRLYKVIIEPIAAIGPVDAYPYELVLPQHSEVVLDGGSPHTELKCDQLFEIAGVVLAARENLDDPPPYRFRHDFVDMHRFHDVSSTWCQRELS